MKHLDRLGKNAAVITSLVLFALLVNLRIISATADESEPQLPQLKIDRHTGELAKTERAADSGAALLNDSVSRFAEKLTSPFGSRPAAFLLHTHLYVVDGQGKLIGRADSLQVRDLPVVSGKNIRLDMEHRRLTDAASLEALELLRHFESQPDLAPLVSGVQVQSDGLVAYMNFGKMVPVIFGTGQLQDKVDNLVDYYFQLGADDLTRKARYLDLRVEDRVVVKKNG